MTRPYSSPRYFAPLFFSLPGWYNRLVRDEILAEWEFCGVEEAVLHVYCHVSGEERWLAPPVLRDYIFRREMQLVSVRSIPSCLQEGRLSSA